MNKSFNEKELSDIMKEIEALEEEFSEEESSDKIEASAMMEELAQMDEEKSIPDTNKADSTLPFEKKTSPPMVASIANTTTNKTTAPTSMEFKVQGDINLALKFDIGGKCIMLDVSEAGLNIKMDGGVSFSVPVNDAQTFKKAV